MMKRTILALLGVIFSINLIAGDSHPPIYTAHPPVCEQHPPIK